MEWKKWKYSSDAKEAARYYLLTRCAGETRGVKEAYQVLGFRKWEGCPY